MAEPDSLRQSFKVMNRFMLLMWRLGLGFWINVWPDVIGRIMVITHTGRKSGLRRRTPVNYAIVDGEVYCVAGFGQVSDWYRNITANPQVEVWLPDGWWRGTAEELPNDEAHLPIMRQVMIASGFAAPLFEQINPRTLSDAELRAITADYRLIHIRREEARTGPDGPGDMAWVWPLAVTILIPLLLMRRRRR